MQQFVDVVMGLIKRKDNLTEDELKELLQRHLVEVQDIRNVRGQEKSKLDEKLREKLELNKGVNNNKIVYLYIYYNDFYKHI